MDGAADIVVLRVGHRPGRDDRMTTHVGLTARALGADRFLLAAAHAGPLERIDDVTSRFGGPFATDRIESARAFLRAWDGAVAHLTMYGMPIQDRIEVIRPAIEPDRPGLVIVVGAEKVPFALYELADWNVAVTNQPHSEVGSLAIFLDRLMEGDGLSAELRGGTHRVVPQECGKRVIERPEVD